MVIRIALSDITYAIMKPRRGNIPHFQGSQIARNRSVERAFFKDVWFHFPNRVDMLKTITRKVTRQLGYELVPLWRMESFHLATHLQRLFERTQVEIVLDVGANAGQYGDFLRRQVGYKGYIVSFEPIPNLAEDVARKCSADAKWTVFPWAMGSADKEEVLNVAHADQFSSFLDADNSLIPKYEGMNTTHRQLRVPVKRLDQVFSSVCRDISPARVYLKMDTQGYDLEVLKGASGILDKVVGLQSEVSLLPIYVGMPDYLTSLRTLTEAGFDISGMFPVNHDEHLRVVEFDCVMIKRVTL